MRIALSTFMVGAATFTFSGGCMSLGLAERWCTPLGVVTWAIATLVLSVNWLEAAAKRG